MTDSLIGGELRERVAVRPADAAPPTPPAGRTLLDVFEATVARCRARTALDAPDATLTYVELWDAARTVAEQLRALGVGPGDRVGVRVPSGTAELYIAILGVLHAGAAYVPVDADDPPGRAETIWRGASACVVVEQGLRIVERAPAAGSDRKLTPEDDAWVIFTSGSTGEPKGVGVEFFLYPPTTVPAGEVSPVGVIRVRRQQ